MANVYKTGKSIHTDNAAQVTRELASLAETGEVTIDASDLAYISSAGLRVLLQLCKKQGHLTVTNVGRDVYEIFEMTGFSEILDVKKALPFVSVEHAKCIGKGVTASVYALDEEMIVKVFHSFINEELAFTEKERSRQAFLAGINTAIPFAIVRTEKGIGVEYELLKADTFIRTIVADPAHRVEKFREYARFIRAMNETKVPKEHFVSAKGKAVNTLALIRESGILSEAACGNYEAFLNALPDRETFIHGDSHPGNVMVSDGEMFFIDMSECGYGHPAFELLSMCTLYYLCPHNHLPGIAPEVSSAFTEEECVENWFAFLSEYLGTDSLETLKAVSEQEEAMVCIELLRFHMQMNGVFPPVLFETLKKIFESYFSENRVPVVF